MRAWQDERKEDSASLPVCGYGQNCLRLILKVRSSNKSRIKPFKLPMGSRSWNKNEHYTVTSKHGCVGKASTKKERSLHENRVRCLKLHFLTMKC